MEIVTITEYFIALSLIPTVVKYTQFITNVIKNYVFMYKIFTVRKKPQKTVK